MTTNEHTIASLENIREALNDTQRQILDAVWEHYLKTGEWVPVRLLHHHFGRSGKATVREALQSLGGDVAFRSGQGNNDHYYWCP